MATVGDTSNEQLNEALENQSLRYFRASRGAAKGKTGPEDTSRFADSLMVLQECAILLGEQLDMNSVSSAISYEGDETVGFCFDPNSSSQNPVVAGGIVNRRMPLKEFVSSIREYIDSQ